MYVSAFIIDADIPPSPSDLTIHTDTFTSSSVSISWTESNSSCVTGYNVSSVLLQSITTSDTTVTVEGLVPSDDQYCIVVTTIDTANRSSSDSDPVCFVFNSELVVVVRLHSFILLLQYLQ